MKLTSCRTVWCHLVKKSKAIKYILLLFKKYYSSTAFLLLIKIYLAYHSVLKKNQRQGVFSTNRSSEMASSVRLWWWPRPGGRGGAGYWENHGRRGEEPNSSAGKSWMNRGPRGDRSLEMGPLLCPRPGLGVARQVWPLRGPRSPHCLETPHCALILNLALAAVQWHLAGLSDCAGHFFRRGPGQFYDLLWCPPSLVALAPA